MPVSRSDNRGPLASCRIGRSRIGRDRTRRPVRAGYTLLELFLAAALSAVIAGACVQATLLVYRTQSVGRQPVILAQVGRIVLQRLRADLGSLVLPDEDALAMTSGEESETLDIGQVTELITVDGTDTSQPEGEIATRPPSLVGDGFSLSLLVDLPASRRDVEIPLDGVPTSDLAVWASGRQRRYVTWTTPLGKSAEIPEEEHLVRYEDWTTSTGLPLASGETLIVPEAVELGFLYYDGSSWLETWNSDEMGTLPVAIEVRMSLLPQAEAAEALHSATGVSSTTFTLTQVIRLGTGLAALELAAQDAAAAAAEETAP